MTEITIPRTGDRPVTFMGDLVAEGHTWRDSTRPARRPTRTYALAIYHIEGDGYLAHVHYDTRWNSESPHDFVLTANRPDVLAERLLQEFDPMFPVFGFVPPEKYAEQQALLVAKMHGYWKSLVGRVLAKVPATGEKPNA